MKVCTCFLLFGILAYTHSFAPNTTKSNQRSVKLALETVLEFSDKDKDVDINILNSVQNFITKVKTVIDENSNDNNLRRNFQAPRIKTFTDFIQDVIRILNTYEDTEFEYFFDILDEEIRNYHYRGCRFYELTENYELRKVIAAKLDSIKGKPISVTKANINALSDMLKDDNYDSNVKEIVNYINSLYKQEPAEFFQKVITDLEVYGRLKYKRSKNNLGKIIKNGVRSIIFNHYTNLNTNVRRDVKQRLETFFKELNKNIPSGGNIPNVKPYSKSRKNAKNFENIMNEVKKPEPVSGKDLMNIASRNANKQIKVIEKHENNKNRIIIKQSEYKKAEMKRDNMKNEKKRYKHTRKVTANEPLDIQEKETRSSHHSGSIIDQQRTRNEHQEQPNIDRLSGESFSSIEFYHEPEHKSTQYIAITPEKVSQKPSTNVTMRMSTNNRVTNMIWIEASTGRLPKVVRDKLTIKPSGHASRHTTTERSLNKHSHKHKKKYYNKDPKKWHGKINEPKYVKMYGKKDDKKHDQKRMPKRWSKNDTEYDSRQKQKSKQDKKQKYDTTSKTHDPFILVHNRDFFKQNYVRTTDSVFHMEVRQYKKSMGPLRMELKRNKPWSTASTRAQKFLKVLDVLMPLKSDKTIKFPQHMRTAVLRKKLNEIRLKNVRPTQRISFLPLTNSSMRRLALAVPRAYSKRNISWKPDWHFKKSASSSDEGMTVETFEIKHDNRRHGQNAVRTASSLEKDPFVIEKIKILEKHFNELKSRFHVNTDVVAAKKVPHRANDDVVKRKQTETTFNSDVNNLHNDYKVSQDKLKMKGTADIKTKHIIENKYVKNEVSTINETEDDIQKGKKSERKFNSDVNMIPNDFKDRTDKTQEAGKPDNKTDVKDKDFKNKDEIFDYYSEIKYDTSQQEIKKKDKYPKISLTNIGEVSPKAKDKGIKVTMNNHDGDDASNETVTENRKISLLTTSTKATESSTKTTMTVQHTVAVTTPTTLKLSSLSVSVPFATSPNVADVFQKAKFNLIVDESINKMIKNTSQVTDVSKNTLNVTKEVTSELLNKNVTNLQSDVTPTT